MGAKAPRNLTEPSVVSAMNPKGKTAIVTGASGALGSVIAEQFLEAGYRIGIPYNSTKPGTSAFVSQSADILAMKADLTSETEVAGFIKEFTTRFGRIDILVNAAGGYAGGRLIEETSLQDMEGMLRLNLTTTYLMCRAVLPIMKRQNSGRIVNIASAPAVTPGARMGLYAISKRAVITLTETIAAEVKGSGLTANVLAPSIILTEANKKSMPDSDTSKWVTPGEIAQMILYLVSDRAGSVNGNVMKIFGGV